jgi:hypothetical protein
MIQAKNNQNENTENNDKVIMKKKTLGFEYDSLSDECINSDEEDRG